MLEIPLRKMFLRMLFWHAASLHGFAINVGKAQRFLKHYIDTDLWGNILRTYPTAEIDDVWMSLQLLMQEFNDVAIRATWLGGQ